MAQGTLRSHLVPPQLPAASLVNSSSPRTAADIDNARRAGIDFFALDWWPSNPGYSGRNYLGANRAMGAFLAAPNLRRIKFAMFYETWNLGFDPGREATPVTPEMEAHFDADMVFFAEHYFSNPSYLRVDGRPVVFMYLTRTLTGDVAGMMDGARRALAALGVDPFFIGDEVYWRVTPVAPTPTSPVLTTVPQVTRIEQFDAVTAYTLYYGDPLPARPDQGLHRVPGRHRHRGRRAQPPGGVPGGDRGPGAGHPRRLAGLQRPGGAPLLQPPGRAPPVAARGGAGLHPRPPVPGGGRALGRPEPAHGDDHGLERVERGHRDRAHRRHPDLARQLPERPGLHAGLHLRRRRAQRRRGRCERTSRSSIGGSRVTPWFRSERGFGRDQARVEGPSRHAGMGPSPTSGTGSPVRQDGPESATATSTGRRLGGHARRGARTIPSRLPRSGRCARRSTNDRIRASL